MGTVFLHGNGGSGGGGLNFQVIGGTTAPSNPKENMIWVNTSTKITSYIFSATQPTGSAGMVWISTGTSSTVEFNALKKNGIQVYPISAQQYVGGAWVNKTAKSYQNGVWRDWFIYIVKNGVISELGLDGVARTGATISMTQQDGSFRITEIGGKSSGVGPSAKANIDKLSEICVTVNITSPGMSTKANLKGTGIGLLSTLWNSSETDLSNAIKYYQITDKTGVQSLSLDVSNVFGDYYVAIIFGSGTNGEMPDFAVIDFYMK